MNVIDEFISRYSREFDYYEQVARLVFQQLDDRLQASGIRAIVTWRAKNPKRLLNKIRKRDLTKNYQQIQEVYDDIVDLAGVRIALYFPGERVEVDKLIREQFFVAEDPKEFRGSDDNIGFKRFSGYWATHYRVRLKPTSDETQQRYSEARVEIQVASVLMHAWAEVNHDLAYKPLQGTLSEDEYAILDELNGLVLAGEISLERLQKAAENRITRQKTPFGNHYELASFLFEATRSISQDLAYEPILGEVDVLFELLRELRLDNPDNVRPYLSELDPSSERRPIAQQVIDQVIAADSSRYAVLENIKGQGKYEISQTSESDSQAIGKFLIKWIGLERFVRELDRLNQPNGSQKQRYQQVMPTLQLVSKLNLFENESDLHAFDNMRRLRNMVVHGIEIPTSDYLDEATQFLEHLINRLKKSKRKDIRRAIKTAGL